MRHVKHEKFLKPRKAFSLIELLIVLMIFSIVTALFIANYRRFGNNVTLSNVADEVALSIREMQTYGLASRRASGDDAQFKRAFGIHVTAASPEVYIMFEDTADPEDRRYTGPAELITQYRLPADIVIDDQCALNANGSPVNSNDPLHISFKRPDPDALIKLENDATTYPSAQICLKSDQNDDVEKVVSVSQAGQIEVIDECSCN